MDKVRITAIFEEDLGNKIIATAKEQKRSKSAMLAIMAEDWYKQQSPTPFTIRVPNDFNVNDLYECDHEFVDITSENRNGTAVQKQCVKCGATLSYT